MSTSELTTNVNTNINTNTSSKPQKYTKEESMLKSYNETFYSSLKGLSFIRDPLPLEEKLMYHFDNKDSGTIKCRTIYRVNFSTLTVRSAPLT